MLQKNTIITCLWLILATDMAIGGQIPSKEELLSLYEKSIGLPEKISLTAEYKDGNTVGIESPIDNASRFIAYRDGERKAVIGRIVAKQKASGKVLRDSNEAFHIDKQSVLIYDKPPRVLLFSEKNKATANAYFFGVMGACMISGGVIPGLGEDAVQVGDKRLADYLRECPDLRVRDEQENIDGHPTFVLEGKSNQGRFIFWLDPNAGYHPRRVELHKTGEDLLYGKLLPDFHFPNPEAAGKTLKEYSVIVDSIKIENINGIFFMTAANMTEIRIYTDGYKILLPSYSSISDINLNPNFEVSKPFEMKVPDGTPVYNEDFPGGRFEVRQGKIVSAGTSFDEIDKTIEKFKQQQ